MILQKPKTIEGPRSFPDCGYLAPNLTESSDPLPLMRLGIDGISVHRNLREELVDQAEEPRIIGNEGRLQKRGGCIFS